MSLHVLKLPQTKSRPKLYEDTDIPYLKRNRDSQIYYVRKFKAGKGELFKTTGEDKKGRALNRADEMIADWLGNRKVLRQVRMDFVVNELEKSLEKEFYDGRRRKRTWDKDRTYLPILRRCFGHLLADEIDEAYWNQWTETDGRRLNRTLGDVGKYLSKALTFAFERKWINRKPRIKNPDPQGNQAVIYENPQIQVFLKHADPLLYDMIILAAENPLRPHEIRELRREWVEIRGKSIVLAYPASFTKVKEARELQVSPNGAAILRRRLKAISGIYLFPAISDPSKPLSECQLSRLWRGMLERAGLKPGPRFHWLRHSFYTKALLDARIPIQLVSEAGGTSITTLQKRYLKSDAKRTAAVSLAVRLRLRNQK